MKKDNSQIEVTNDEEPAWFWIKKGNRFYDQAEPGDSVVRIEREQQNAKRPDSAYRHVAIKGITTDSDVNAKAYHYAYTKDHIVKWSEFEMMAKRAGISRLGSGRHTVRELSERQSNVLFELWKT